MLLHHSSTVDYTCTCISILHLSSPHRFTTFPSLYEQLFHCMYMIQKMYNVHVTEGESRVEILIWERYKALLVKNHAHQRKQALAHKQRWVLTCMPVLRQKGFFCTPVVHL